MKKVFAITLVSFWISACDTQVQKFVDVLPSQPDDGGPHLAVDPPTLKISPGEVRGASANLGLTATITPTQQKMTSATLGMTVGISKMSR